MRIHLVAALAPLALLSVSGLPLPVCSTAFAQEAPTPPEFPPFGDVSKGFEKVATSSDGAAPMYTIYKRDKDARLLAELPRNFESQKIMIATTYAGGVSSTGIQLGDTYCYWRRYDKKLALIEPNTGVRATGDQESKKSSERLYTDRVLLEVPIATMGPGGGPVIDLSGLLVGQCEKFFGGGAARNNKGLTRITKCKTFPQNVELAFEMPGGDGRLQTLYYSISVIPERTGYQPREADLRVGYFTTAYRDVSRQSQDTQWVRYINRWWVEKRDPKLAMSPPKQPIVFYLEHTIPVHYRKYIREGVLEWNKAFEKIGIDGAIEVVQQDASSGANMDKDPEDVRYNFIRWTSTDMGFSIGPSRVHPETGQILDADVVLDDGFIRGWFRQFGELLPEVAMTGYPAEVTAWLEKNPQWDPRVRLAEPGDRDAIVRQRTLLREAAEAEQVKAVREGTMEASAMPMLTLRSGAPLQFGAVGMDPTGQLVSPNAMLKRSTCAAMLGKALDVAMIRFNYEEIMALNDDPPSAEGEKKDDAKKGDGKKDEKKEAKKQEQMLDGMPESFVGPLMRDLVAHEVGHTLGLRHNFKASTWKSLKEMNDPACKGKEPIVASVMDYTPLNINMNDGPVQGDYGPIGIGPYDYWVIEYGYTTESGKLKDILARSSEPGLAYGTDEDLGSSDPVIKQFDLGRDSLDYAESTIRLAQHLRTKIATKVVKDGDSWAKGRRAWELLLSRHVAALRIASYYVGGADINRVMKGQAGAKEPVVPIDPVQQRRALKLIVDNAFRDEAYGLDRELLNKMTVDKWMDDGGAREAFSEPAYQFHDRVLGIQSAVVTMLMNPITLQRVYDAELRRAPDQDALTIPELLDAVVNGSWTELDKLGDGTARKPSISSLRRNLQRELTARMIDLTLPDGSFTAAYRPIQNLTVLKLRELKGKIDKNLSNGGLDPYTKAHLTEISVRIGKALDATYIYQQ
ncbi:MAG: zinc-dependent metalloprotease [Phycisphaerales bacterium]